MNKLYVVGIGPGAADQMTVKALRALENCDVIAGYGVYVDLVKPLLPDKEYLVTPCARRLTAAAWLSTVRFPARPPP